MSSLLSIVAKGNSHNLMKITSKRRRPKAQIALEKKMEEEREANIAKRLSQMEDLEKQMKLMQVELDQHADLKNQVEGMFSQGKLKQDGNNNIHVVENPLEQQMLFLRQ